MKLIKLFIILFPILILSEIRLNAQWVLLTKESELSVRKGLDAMYNLRYNEADSLFNKIIVQYPDNPVGNFLLGLVDWWRIATNFDVSSKVQRYSDTYYDKLNKSISLADSKLSNNPRDIVGLFFKGAALGYKARLKVSNFGSSKSLTDVISAAIEGQQAFQILQKCKTMMPSNSDVLLGSGLFYYFSDYLPKTYPQFKSAFGFLPPGDKTLGLQMLEISGRKALYSGVEAKYSQLEILSNLEGNHTKSLEVAKDLFSKYPNNPVFHKFLAKSYSLTLDLQNAETEWINILQNVKARKSGYELSLAKQGLYYLGDIRLRQNKYESAILLYKECVKVCKRMGVEEESGWAILANLKIGYSYDMLGKRKEAINMYKDVLDMNDFSKAHENAAKYLKTAYKQ
ncbi:MAG: tetratricopeptide repeat protein [Chlorobiota bacterium]|nr:tetratricopeptide repeat protein [Chlorobiota bacterium]QQS66102.1 MAG: tetratricopeptide repeat protein [Chlorobiota bacterium]